MSLKPAWLLDGRASIWAFARGTGTRDEEKGVAPAEKGTLGLLVPLSTIEPLPNAVMNDPEKSRLDWEALATMERTSAPAPARPPNGGAAQDLDCVSQTATAEAGDVNLPPTHTWLCALSQ